MENLFEPILDKDEKIIKVFKPNKFKFYVSNVIGIVFFFLFLFLPIMVGIVLEEGGFDDTGFFISIFIVAFIFSLALVILFTEMYYRKRVYAYSNKRIIIRTGVIGVDFKSLDMSMIGAVNVYVSFLDKVLGRNTGTITFGSTASPIVNYGNNAKTNPYKFSGIVAPYELYKEIKSVIDEYKENKQKTK